MFINSAFAITTIAACILCPLKASAQYAYLSGSAKNSHAKLIDDIQNDRVDTRYVSPEGVRFIADFSPHLRKKTQGKKVLICQTLEVRFIGGSSLAFDTFHGDVAVGWTVKVSKTPERVLNIAALILPPNTKPGPPAILPSLGPDDKIIPPITLGCGPVISIPAREKDRGTCAKWPEMCS